MARTLLRGARLVTMAADRPDCELADVLIEAGCIVEIGPDLPDERAEVVELTGRLVMPGLVNAHLHTARSVLSSCGIGRSWTDHSADGRVDGAGAFTPEFLRLATAIGGLNQINCGTTTLGNWDGGSLGVDHTEAAFAGLGESGIRAVLLHGSPAYPPGARHSRAEVERLLRGPFADRSGLLRLGMAINGPQYSDPGVVAVDFRLAAEYELTVSMYQSGISSTAAEGWEALDLCGLLGPRTNVVHGAGLTYNKLRRLVDYGVSFTLIPENEIQRGRSVTAQLLKLGAEPSLGTGADIVGCAQVQGAARTTLAHQRILDRERRSADAVVTPPLPPITCRQVLSWVTSAGARALGLAGEVGCLGVGMRADLVVVDVRAMNLWSPDQAIMAALHAGPEHIESVMIDGRWRKYAGKLVGVDLSELRSALQESVARVFPALLAGKRGRDGQSPSRRCMRTL
ncbi:amidohydrolase family protein [Nocardia vaccinii]|uniref:amidohydrolase family protein n=1 Tax=Nocardia vaccinii TaxID=1822 RepID=UPI00082E9696|nr:amidohydrolase family protein [Nocardia vaccinii]